MQFNVGDHVYLRVSPTKGVQRSGIKGKLAPRYIGPYEIIEACGPVAYRLRLPSQLAAVHNVFHVSQLKKCVRVPTDIIEQQEIFVEPDLSYDENPIKVLDQKERSTRKRWLKYIKFSGIITLKKKLPGRPKVISINTIRVFFHLPRYLHIRLRSFIQSRDEILFKGGRL